MHNQTTETTVKSVMSRTTIVKSHVLHVKLSFTYTNVLPVNTIIVIIYINQFTLDKNKHII